ncbi:hypothetical protein CSPX01_16294 [Colletotrichum filicis]|nr:hypothetical protein CSPX01_16294 [Colletotrichum filicis]
MDAKTWQSRKDLPISFGYLESSRSENSSASPLVNPGGLYEGSAVYELHRPHVTMFGDLQCHAGDISSATDFGQLQCYRFG